MRTTIPQLLSRLRSLKGQNCSSLVLFVMKFLKVQVLVKNRLLYTLILVTNEIVHTVWPSNDVPAEIVSWVSLYILFGYTTGNSSQLKRYNFLKTLAGFASDLANFTEKPFAGGFPDDFRRDNIAGPHGI